MLMLLVDPIPRRDPFQDKVLLESFQEYGPALTYTVPVIVIDVLDDVGDGTVYPIRSWPRALALEFGAHAPVSVGMSHSYSNTLTHSHGQVLEELYKTGEVGQLLGVNVQAEVLDDNAVRPLRRLSEAL